MAFTAFRTWVTGEVVTAAQLNEQIRDNGNALLAIGWNVVLGGSGSVITTDTYVDVRVPCKCDITSVEAFGDDTDGTITVDIRKIVSSDYATAQPADSDSIVASAPITLDTDDSGYSYDATLTGWTKGLVATNLLRYYVEACATTTQCTVYTDADRS